LQPLQTFQQYGHHTFVSDVTDNSRHKVLPGAEGSAQHSNRSSPTG
jgi:hypothetical protein